MDGMPRWLRAVVLLIVIAVVVVVLFEFVFPWVEGNWYNPSIE